jgi:xanthine dehydrogenase accessory factor
MPGSHAQLLNEAVDWKQSGRAVAIATVVETWGSAPRPPGSHLIVDELGNFLGSVSGGCVEAEVITESLEIIASGRPRLLEFGVADSTAWSSGLSCGGKIKVYVERLDRIDLILALNQEQALRRPCIFLRNLTTGAQRLLREADFAGEPWAKELDNKTGLRRSGLLETSEAVYFIELHLPPTRLIAIGAVHISQALAPLAKLAGFELIIIDPRTGFASPERFPETELIGEWPEAVFERQPLDKETGVLLLTHEPRIDDEALRAALAADCFYIGALGSKKTHAKRIERMLDAGFSNAALAKIHAPIGLDIGAATPAEIAIAIIAEIIHTRRQMPKPVRPELAA